MAEPIVVNEEEVVTTTPPDNGQGNPPDGDGEPGSKTPSPLLLKSLQEEKDKRRKLEEEKAALELALQEEKERNAILSDPDADPALLRIAKVEDQLAVTNLLGQFPVLKEHTAEFDEFRKQYPNVALESVAKLFINENDLAPVRRAGLEDRSGGGRQTPPAELSPEEISDLRTKNPRKYSQLIREGKINL